VAPERRDPALGDKLKAAAGVILAWAIRGAADYYQHGIQEPDAVSKATQAYAADQDTVRRFVDDQVLLCVTNQAARVAIGDLRSAYEKWCSDVGEMPVSAKRLSQELAEKFDVNQVKGNRGKRFYAGLTMANATDDDDREPPDHGWDR
jgi:putative DNA primase/helicase